MILSTSANGHRQAEGYALVHGIASVFLAVFGAVYESYSHGVYSYFMLYAFLFPLILGVLPCLVLVCKHAPLPSGICLNAWNSGIACLTVGSLFRGALEIYGTTSRFSPVYFCAAVPLLVTGIFAFLREEML